MEKLSYKTLENVGYDGYLLKDAKEKVLQFGEGNFLRAFVDYWFDLANEKADWNGKCCLVQPIAPGLAEMINEQDGLYTLHLRGSVNGEKVDDITYQISEEKREAANQELNALLAVNTSVPLATFSIDILQGYDIPLKVMNTLYFMVEADEE